jgi:hypothetical protein
MARIFHLFLICTLLTFTNLYGQSNVDYEWYLTESNGGLCNQSLLLFKDSSYCSESGCEASSYFSFGKWKQKNNVITLIPADPAKYNFIEKVESKTTNDNKLTVIVLDKAGNNITNKVLVGQYVEGKGMYPLSLDTSKAKRTDFKRNNSTIILTSLQRLFKQKIEIRTDSSNFYKIYLTIPEQWNFHENSVWESNGTFSLTKKNDRLFTIVPDHFDDKGNLVPSEYIRQVADLK